MTQSPLTQLIERASEKLHEPVHNAESLNQWKAGMFNFINAIAELKLPSLSQFSQENSSLDPADWISARHMAHQMLDSSLDHIEFIRDRPIRRAMPHNICTILREESLPEHGQSLYNVCCNVLDYIMPYSRGNIHPRFWDAVSGAGTLGGVIGEMISAALNINTITSNHSPALVEMTVIDWMCTLFGFSGDNSGGILTSGTSMGTMISLATARQKALINVKENGLFDAHRLITYASVETHVCIVRALELLGLGSQSLHFIPTDENFCIEISELKSAIVNDRNKGLIPFCIVGNAGKCSDKSFALLLFQDSLCRCHLFN